MDTDILTPAFFEYAEKLKALFAEKEKEISTFKEVWVRHKATLAELESKAQQLKLQYDNSQKSNQQKS